MPGSKSKSKKSKSKKSKSKEKTISFYDQVTVQSRSQPQMYDPFASGWLEHPLGSEHRPLSHLSVSSSKSKSNSKPKKSKSKSKKSKSRKSMSVQFPLFKPKTNAPKAEKRKTQSR